jgi:hypothetical protein
MCFGAIPTPRPPRAQRPQLPRRQAQHPGTSKPPRAQNTSTTRARQPPATQLSLDYGPLVPYDEHGCPLSGIGEAPRRGPPDTNTSRLGGGASARAGTPQPDDITASTPPPRRASPMLTHRVVNSNANAHPTWRSTTRRWRICGGSPQPSAVVHDHGFSWARFAPWVAFTGLDAPLAPPSRPLVYTLVADVKSFATMAFATRTTHKTTATMNATPLRGTTKPVRRTIAQGAMTIKIHGFSGTTALQ